MLSEIDVPTNYFSIAYADGGLWVTLLTSKTSSYFLFLRNDPNKVVIDKSVEIYQLNKVVKIYYQKCEAVKVKHAKKGKIHNLYYLFINDT